MPRFDPPRHDRGETIRSALNLGVSVKMITGTNMYPPSALLGDESIVALPVDDLIEKADAGIIFVTRSRSWSFVEHPGMWLVFAFILAQLVATLIASLCKLELCCDRRNRLGMGWLYNITFYIPLDFIKLFIRYALSGRVWVLSSNKGLLSQGKRISGKNKESCNGRTHKERSTGYNHQILRCSHIEPISTNLTKWLKKPRGEPKSLGCGNFTRSRAILNRW
ncbi:unnamed protein product [Arabis nemorensis]|uniref:Uncharacterized protein n=1 Tax=Arabis nemorensis TaxID=586526 RepID=A0A565BSX8_9BRAS|nr:unnamed protein product [Arabis nemorensis]